MSWISGESEVRLHLGARERKEGREREIYRESEHGNKKHANSIFPSSVSLEINKNSDHVLR